MPQTKNQAGVAITIKAFLPTGTTINEQIRSLSMVKTAHETQNYSEVLATAEIIGVKVEQKNRRVPIEPLNSDDGLSTTEEFAHDTRD